MVFSGTVTGGIVRSGQRRTPGTPQTADPYLYNTPAYTSKSYTTPPPPPPPGTQPPGCGQGTQFVKQASDQCSIQ